MKFHENSLFAIVKRYVPSSNVKITAAEINGNIKTIKTNNFCNISFIEFIDYVSFPQRSNSNAVYPVEILKQLPLGFTEVLNDSGDIVAKLALLPVLNSYMPNALGIVISNGIRITEFNAFAGFLITDDTPSIQRNTYTKSITFENLKEWAIKQKQKIEINISLFNLYSGGFVFQNFLIAFNLHDDNLPILMKKENRNYSIVKIKDFRE
jgi:hypothetical protein